MTVKIASSLPSGESNGLTAIAEDLIDEPQRVHVVIALVDCAKTTTDNDTGERTPTARLRRAEVITDEQDMDRLRRLVTRAYEARTGKAVLPLDLEDELRDAFGSESDE